MNMRMIGMTRCSQSHTQVRQEKTGGQGFSHPQIPAEIRKSCFRFHHFTR